MKPIKPLKTEKDYESALTVARPMVGLPEPAGRTLF